MFEEFTDRAKKIMALSNQAAQSFDHEQIGPEHMLLGLIKEGPNANTGARLLNELLPGKNFDDLRNDIGNRFTKGISKVSAGKLPMTDRAKKVIEFAIEEARELGHSHIGTEHLFLGLIRSTGDDDTSVPVKVFADIGITIEAAREKASDFFKQQAQQGGVFMPATLAQPETPSMLLDADTSSKIADIFCDHGIGFAAIKQHMDGLFRKQAATPDAALNLPEHPFDRKRLVEIAIRTKRPNVALYLFGRGAKFTSEDIELCRQNMPHNKIVLGAATIGAGMDKDGLAEALLLAYKNNVTPVAKQGAAALEAMLARFARTNSKG